MKSIRAYLLKEDFRQFRNYTSPTWAGKFLDDWCGQVMRSQIEPMKRFARTLRNHREVLLNYFRARKAFSSGVILPISIGANNAYVPGIVTHHDLATAGEGNSQGATTRIASDEKDEGELTQQKPGTRRSRGQHWAGRHVAAEEEG